MKNKTRILKRVKGIFIGVSILLTVMSCATTASRFKDMKQSAETGNAGAQYELGYMYYNGKGTPVDQKKAVYWFSKSAEQEFPKAQVILGAIYLTGKGAPIDSKKAFSLLTKGAKQEYDEKASHYAQFLLGSMYYHGMGIPANKSKGIYWFKKSADQGNSAAIKMLKKIESRK